MKEEQHITIKIANLPPIEMTVKSEDEEMATRKAARAVNSLLDDWSRRFSRRSSDEVLARVALQFARYYYLSQESLDSVDAQLAGLEAEFDTLLGGQDAPASVDPAQ